MDEAEKKRRAAERSKAWRAANPDRVRLQSHICVQRRKEKWQEFLASERLRYRRRRELVLARQKERREGNRENVRAIQRKHYRQNKEKAVANCALRRAKKMSATPPWVDNREIQAFYLIARAMTLKAGVPHEVDHILPLTGRAACGLHVPWNLQVITRDQNRRKHNGTDGVSNQAAPRPAS